MPWNDKRVLVTGGTGFIGQHLVKKLQQQGAQVVSFGHKLCDLSQMNQVAQFFSRLKNIDVIMHLATFQRTGEVQYRIKGELFYINTLIHFNLLHAWRSYLPSAKLLTAGCSCAYPEKNALLSEVSFWDGKLHDSVETYGFTKKLLYIGQKSYSEQYGLISVHVIFPTVYGPGDHYEKNQSHFITALIKRLIDAKRNNIQEVEVWGDGSQVRECLYIDDQLDALCIAAERLREDLINVGENHGYTVKEIAENIKEVVEYDGKIVYNTNKYTGVPYKVLDATKFKKLTGWTPRENLTTGLKKTIESYVSLGCDEQLK